MTQTLWIHSVVDAFGAVTVEIAVDAAEVVGGIQRGLILVVLDGNATVVGNCYSALVHPDPIDGRCRVNLVPRPAGP